mgnify:CR=1 FL=1
MIDIINAHTEKYDNIVLLTGFLNPRETPLNEKVKVKMCKAYDRSTAISRFYSWLVFWLQSFFYVFFVYNKHKLYFVTNPPLNVFLANFTKRTFAFLVYDIYPEALSRYNYLKKDSFLYRFWQKKNFKVYSKAQKLFTISHSMRDAMLSSGIEQNRVDIIPVWSSSEFFQDIPCSNNLFLKQNNINNKFIVGYSGNLGKSQPLEIIIQLADLLKHQKDILFLILGEGEKKKTLLNSVKGLSLDNIRIMGYQETKLYPHVLAAFHVGVITSDAKASDLNVPSKIYNIMSAGKPVMGISSEHSELAKLIRENDIGQNFSLEDLEGMRSFVLKLKNNADFYFEKQSRSRKTSLKFTSKNAQKMIL